MNPATICLHNAPQRTNVTKTQGKEVPRWGWPELYLIAQTALPALLFFPGTQPLRLPIRVSPYVLGFVVAWFQLRRANCPPHPALPWLLAVSALLGLMLLHPMSSLQAGAAQIALSLAIMLPVFWLPGLIQGPEHLKRLLWILLLCSGLNAAVGVLQVYDPDRWLPQEFSEIATASYGGALSYEGRDGRRIVRPTGLFDTPGAVCGPGAVAAVLGFVFATAPYVSMLKRVLALSLAFSGLSVIFLTQVRANFVVILISAAAFAAVLFLQKRGHRAVGFVALVALLVTGAMAFAVTLGGDLVRTRFASLVEDDPFDVYYKNRGVSLENAFEELVYQYPLGAGLGRWGMVAHYFGDHSDHQSSVFAEIQPNAWIMDGGILLLLLYFAALVTTTSYEYNIALTTANYEVQHVAAIVCALNVGTAALTFSFVPFVCQVGIQFWFLAGALHGAVWWQGRQERLHRS